MSALHADRAVADRDHVDLGGTLRARTPEETLAFVRPRLRAIGITRVARVTGLDRVGIPVSLAFRPMARSLSVSQGKGVTPLLADVSAIMESTELFHAETAEPAAFGSYRRLSSRLSLVHPSALIEGAFPRDDDDFEQGWTTATDLVTGTRCLVPHAAVSLDEPSHGRESERLFVSTNGLASGNTIAEATCHALYEVVERDAMSEWQSGSDEAKDAREVDWRTVGGSTGDLLERAQRAELEPRIWEITAANGIPTFVCELDAPSELRTLGSFSGIGTHHRKEIALSRAVTEAAQSRLTVVCGTREDIVPSRYSARRFDANVPFAKSAPPKRSFDACIDAPLERTLDANLRDIVRRLTLSGASQVLRVDHTRAELEIPVVHCFVPGMKCVRH